MRGKAHHRRPRVAAGRVARLTFLLLACAGGAMHLLYAGTPQKQVASAGMATENIDPQGCAKCHAGEVEGFSRSRMAHSMRRAGLEPTGAVTTPAGTVQVGNSAGVMWQEVRSADGSTMRRRMDFVVGSGAHAEGYLTITADHLYQSPVAYYTRLAKYGMAPGFETAEPDFSRAVTPACLFCHAEGTLPVAGTDNVYRPPMFTHLGITCDRCHGDTTAHLARPTAQNIVNPAHLHGAVRDSVCEQCHLIGAARILNPGKQFTDFRAGTPLEETFTTYRLQPADGKAEDFRVISHSEQLALSACARNSGGRLWCGTCHDPHDEPTEPVAFYRERCLSCHAKTVLPASHPARDSNCIGCHMPRRDAVDGGHTTFTDHRIQRAPQPASGSGAAGELTAWREPAAELRDRNLGLSLVGRGIEQRSPHEIVRGYRLLAGVQERFQSDPELFAGIGNALLLGRQTAEAASAFEIAARLDPGSSDRHGSLGGAYALLGRNDAAEQELKRALEIDPLNLSAAKSLIDVYAKTGNTAGAAALAARFAEVEDLRTAPAPAR